MHRLGRLLGVSLAAVPLFLTGTAAAAAPIGPHQHFVGLVNGSHRDPVVHTVCPGPAGPHRQGPVAGGQTVAVLEKPNGPGYTGPFSQVYAWFTPAPGGPRPVQITLTTYSSPRAIPTAIRVPCQGSGTVTFSSCPYLAPCAAGWVQTSVRVRFVDIAA
jgi:hypothetical protein